MIIIPISRKVSCDIKQQFFRIGQFYVMKIALVQLLFLLNPIGFAASFRNLRIALGQRSILCRLVPTSPECVFVLRQARPSLCHIHGGCITRLSGIMNVCTRWLLRTVIACMMSQRQGFCDSLDLYFTNRQVKCKHIWAVEISLKLREAVQPRVIEPIEIRACIYCKSQNLIRWGGRTAKQIRRHSEVLLKSYGKSFAVNEFRVQH